MPKHNLDHVKYLMWVVAKKYDVPPTLDLHELQNSLKGKVDVDQINMLVTK
ncbi:hypothetical protein J2Z48_001560 [Croceifilum oryzae]|uniref:Uncharacterized protein n=1 Tax=Croceifilum oryzae TaxID=1553429 RepID=A0AAJ1WQC0_9BACL|nr:hypothetical protein [Croceifilum oryzae]MDQ0417387.1 hypothetical protein [Croceifilum oryzae]